MSVRWSRSDVRVPPTNFVDSPAPPTRCKPCIVPTAECRLPSFGRPSTSRCGVERQDVVSRKPSTSSGRVPMNTKKSDAGAANYPGGSRVKRRLIAVATAVLGTVLIGGVVVPSTAAAVAVPTTVTLPLFGVPFTVDITTGPGGALADVAVDLRQQHGRHGTQATQGRVRKRQCCR